MINISFPNADTSKKLTIHDLIDGRAYVVSNNAFGIRANRPFICNKFENVVLFSIDGGTVITNTNTKSDEDFEFEEVDLEVQVNRK